MNKKEQQAWDDYYKETQQQNWAEEDAEYYRNPPPHPHEGLPSYQGNRNLFQAIGLLIVILGIMTAVGGMCFLFMAGVEMQSAEVQAIVINPGVLCLMAGVFVFGLGLLAFIPDGITR